VSNRIELNIPEILLVKEFAELMKKERNICKQDPEGKYALRAFREFTYIWLAIDWKSLYADYTPLERHNAALQDASMTEEEFNNPEFRAACRKYEEIQNSNKSLRLLQSARDTVDKLILYFDNLDIEERDPVSGKPLFQAKNVIAEITSLNKVHESLITLENMVKKQITDVSNIRGGVQDGYQPSF
jgi:hypothetical protein